MRKLIAGLSLLTGTFVVLADALPWEFDASAQTISDGTWTLMAKDLGGKCLRIGLDADERSDGRTNSPWAFPVEIATPSTMRMDLTGAVYTKGQVGDESALWKITEVKEKAFADAPEGLVTEFIAPLTLTKYGYQTFNNTKGLTEAVFNCPELVGAFCNWGWDFTHASLSRLVLNFPKVEKIGTTPDEAKGSLSHATFSETDLSTWDLTGVKSVGDGALQAGGNKSCSGGPTGDLLLPNVEEVGDGAFNCWTRVSSVALGTQGTLKSLGKTLFWNPDAKSGLAVGPKKIDFGKSWNFSVHEQAFYAELPGKVDAWPDGMPLPLEEICFASHAPSVETIDRILALQVPGENGTKPVVISAPMDDVTWQMLCRPFADEAEEAAARATGRDVIGVYVRADGMRVAWLCPRTTVTAMVRDADSSAGSVTIMTNGVPIASGTELMCGTEVTVTAMPALPTMRISWEGALPDGTTPTEASFTFRVGRSPSVFTAVFSCVWEYDAESKTLSDGVWTLNAEPMNVEARKLRIAQTTNVVETARKSELNLMGYVYTKGMVGSADALWTIVEIDFSAFRDFSITSFDAPTTLATFGGQIFNNGQFLSRVSFKCPNLTKFGEWGYMFRAGVANMVFDAPLLGEIGKTGADFSNVTFSKTDLSMWNLTSLTNIYENGFSIVGPGPEGVLILPNLNVAGNFAFKGWKNLTAAALGTNGTLKTLGSQIFAGNTAALKRLYFGASAAFTAQSDTFLAASDIPLPLEEVWFAGAAPSAEVLDCILALRSVAADGTKPVKIYAPMLKRSWQTHCRPIESAERQAAQTVSRRTGHRVVGVYQTLDGHRVAWLMQRPGLDYLAGFQFIIR